jgi:tRNA 2-thiouridine synthesizing protein A
VAAIAREGGGVYQCAVGLTEGAAMDGPVEVDARGLLCPLPVLRARRRLLAMAPGERLRLLTDDPAAAVDVPHFCAEAGHTLLAEGDAGHAARVWVIVAGGSRDRVPA